MSLWPLVRLSECCEIVGGATPSTSELSNWGGDVHWATPKDLSDLKGSYLDATPRTLTQSGLASCSASILPPRSVLFSSRAPIGLVAINRVPVATNQGFKSFVPDGSRVHAEYLFHWLRTHRPMLESLGNGATFKEVSKAVVSRVAMPLPPLPDQRRIAEVLDRAETLRAQRRQALAQLDALAESIFLDMFGEPIANTKGWQRVPMSDVLERIESGQSPICLDRVAVGDEWAVLKLGAVTRCVFDAKQNKAVSAGFVPNRALEVHNGDLLFTRKNTPELVAACALVVDTPARLLLPDLIFRLCLRKDATVTKQYLQRLLTSPTKRAEIQKLAGGSAGSMPNISKARLLTATIERPPLHLQQEFGRRVAAIDGVRRCAHAVLRKLDALFASLQHRAFRGEL